MTMLDAVALLWRMRLGDIDVGNRWDELAATYEKGRENGGAQKRVRREAAESRGVGGAAQALDQAALEHRPADDRAEIGEDPGMAVFQVGIHDDPGPAMGRHGAERPQHAGRLLDLVVPIGIAVHEIGEVADGVQPGGQSA